jgi:transposase
MRPPGTHRPSGHELSPHKRARICALRDAGLSYPEISDREGIIVPTCKSTFKKQNRRVSCITRPRSGRPPKLSARDKRRIVRDTRLFPKKLIAQLKIDLQLDVSPKTITRFMATLGISKWKALHRPFITVETARARQKWAMDHIH